MRDMAVDGLIGLHGGGWWALAGGGEFLLVHFFEGILEIGKCGVFFFAVYFAFEGCGWGVCGPIGGAVCGDVVVGRTEVNNAQTGKTVMPIASFALKSAKDHAIDWRQVGVAWRPNRAHVERCVVHGIYFHNDFASLRSG